MEFRNFIVWETGLVKQVLNSAKPPSLSRLSVSSQEITIDSPQIAVPAHNSQKWNSVAWKRKEKSIVASALALFLFLIVKDAWLNDDSYITFRIVDNFVHGYGLT